jgi:FG-GAP-like repeat
MPTRARTLGVLVPLAMACGSQNNFNGKDAGGTDGNQFGFEAGFGDVASPDGEGGPPVDPCHVPPDDTSGNAPMCTAPPAPPNSFNPVLKWSWTDPQTTGTSFYEGSMVTPIVANFTDDNGDGMIDLCDIPDVIVATGGGPIGAQGSLYMLAGDTGKLEYTFDLPGDVDSSVNPALGDIDGDGIPEVLANDTEGHLVAFDNKGKVKWKSTVIGAYKSVTASYCHAIAIHDLDGDGNPEIIVAFEVYDNKGNLKFGYDESSFDGAYWCPANTAADLDGDGKMEVIFGNAAFHSDGTKYWSIAGPPGQPQVADLNQDGTPEIFVAREDGIVIVSHDGQILSGPTQLYDPQVSPNCWSKPGVVHDFDGDGHPDISDSSCAHVSVYHVNQTTFQISVNWSEPIDDTSGLASSTAFDFLGSGIAEGVYGDQDNLWVFDGLTGKVQMSATRASGTLIEYPIVADVDNDGSADIVVVSNVGGDMPSNYKHTVDVYEDSMKRWIPTRRIWNQHAYYVSNVREDGTIPPHPQPSWLGLNTFRTNSEIQAGQNCAPPPPNVH